MTRAVRWTTARTLGSFWNAIISLDFFNIAGAQVVEPSQPFCILHTLCVRKDWASGSSVNSHLLVGLLPLQKRRNDLLGHSKWSLTFCLVWPLGEASVPNVPLLMWIGCDGCSDVVKSFVSKWFICGPTDMVSYVIRPSSVGTDTRSSLKITVVGVNSISMTQQSRTSFILRNPLTASFNRIDDRWQRWWVSGSVVTENFSQYSRTRAYADELYDSYYLVQFSGTLSLRSMLQIDRHSKVVECSTTDVKYTLWNCADALEFNIVQRSSHYKTFLEENYTG